ncbi:MAG: hypothetical protein ACKOC1_01110 [Hyphomicrobiales bacterium]
MIFPEDPEFTSNCGRLLEIAGKNFKIRQAIKVTATKISRIRAPSYSIFPDRMVAEQQARGYATYGVRPI